MKHIYTFLAAALLCVSLAACGCSNSAPATLPATRPTTPSMTLPTMETNIPDPEVDPYATEGTDPTETTGILDKKADIGNMK